MPGFSEAFIRSSYATCVGNFSMFDSAYLAAIQRGNRYRLAVERNELHLVGLALAVHMNNRPDIARGQLFARKIGHQHYAVMLLQSVHGFPL